MKVKLPWRFIFEVLAFTFLLLTFFSVVALMELFWNNPNWLFIMVAIVCFFIWLFRKGDSPKSYKK